MYLGLDLGTTNVKVIVVNEDGKVAARHLCPVDRERSTNGSVEQDIEQIWDATCHCIREATCEVAGDTIQAVGVSSQGAAIQVLDALEKPLGKVISWLDSRGFLYDQQLTEELGSQFFSGRLGHEKSCLAAGQILRLQSTSPVMLNRDNHIAFVGDVVTGRLCGRRAHDATSLAIAMLYNPWLQAADPELLQRLSLSEQQLPDLLPASSIAGVLSGPASEATGLPDGTPVSPAVHDQYASALGAGSIEIGSVSVGTGSSWVLLANCEALTEPVIPSTFVCRHLVEELYGQLLTMGTGGVAIEWAWNLSNESPVNREQLDEYLSEVPVGSDGLRFQPSLLLDLSERKDTSASLTGISLHHSFKHILRAVVEGLALELARYIGRLREAGMLIQELVLCGEAAHSPVTRQVIANSTGMPVNCVTEPFVSARGAAVLARSLVVGDDLKACAKLLAPESIVVRRDEDFPLYQELLKN
ncbi:xylulokinase [Adhaeretor mobilis]|uniref:L-fuculokinase n=1 Tax=Adhaeretor mobilis TaxID=1930276 RepID=A0A517MTI9_9BACT|nr:FGGY-family carbohydrate kinase [Adhaeretor mobilis]QDS98203.1 L-fuculokinase [Adhaeretor mobilis]